MNREKEQFAGMSKWGLGGAALALLLAGGAGRIQAQASGRTTNAARQTMTTQSKFYCNIKALTPTERAHHKQLTEKLIAARQHCGNAKGLRIPVHPGKCNPGGVGRLGGC